MADAVTDLQRANAALTAGFSGGDLTIAVAVSIAENRDGDPAATHKNLDGTIDYGLWQINSVHFDPGGLLAGMTPSTVVGVTDNARAARAIFNAQGWHAWSTYNSGAYLLFMPRAKAVVPKAAVGGTVTDPATVTVNPLTTLGNAASGALKAGAWLGNPHNWMRIAQVLLGGAVIVVGLTLLVENTSAGKAAVGAVAKGKVPL